MLKNPFVIYGYKGPEYFCDRQEETRKLISALSNERNVTLAAPRRIGKTGLIRHAFHEIEAEEKNTRCFYIDILQTKTLEQLVQLMARNIIGQLDTMSQTVVRKITTSFASWRPVISFDEVTGLPSVTLDIQPQDGERTLKQIFEYMRQSGKRCYVAIDEFQQILNYSTDYNVEAMLRSYIQFLPNVYFIFAGSRQHILEQMFTSASRPFFQGAQLMTLSTIDEPVYYDFAAGFFSKQGRDLPQEVFHAIYARVDGITWYIQDILNRLYEDEDQIITPDNVDDVVAELVDEQSGAFSNYYQPLTAAQAQLLKAIAKEGVATSLYDRAFVQRYGLGATSTIRTSLKALLNKELVYDAPDGYVVYDRLFREWLRRLA